MSRIYKSRAKKVHKMSRDGLIEKNAVTGDERRISQRGQDFSLKQINPFSHQAVEGEAGETVSLRDAFSKKHSRREQQKLRNQYKAVENVYPVEQHQRPSEMTSGTRAYDIQQANLFEDYPGAVDLSEPRQQDEQSTRQAPDIPLHDTGAAAR